MKHAGLNSFGLKLDQCFMIATTLISVHLKDIIWTWTTPFNLIHLGEVQVQQYRWECRRFTGAFILILSRMSWVDACKHSRCFDRVIGEALLKYKTLYTFKNNKLSRYIQQQYPFCQELSHTFHSQRTACTCLSVCTYADSKTHTNMHTHTLMLSAKWLEVEPCAFLPNTFSNTTHTHTHTLTNFCQSICPHIVWTI
jgi:hypothetical protein